MVHVAHEVLPVWVMVDEGSAVNIELEQRLKPSIDILVILCVTLNLDDFKLFFVSLLIFDFLLLGGGLVKNG